MYLHLLNLIVIVLIRKIWILFRFKLVFTLYQILLKKSSDLQKIVTKVVLYCTDYTVSVVPIVLDLLYWLYWINCTDSDVRIALYQLYWLNFINCILYCIWCSLGERIRPQIDVSYEYVEEGDALDLRCNVRVSFQIWSQDLFFKLKPIQIVFIRAIVQKNLEYRIIFKVFIW